MRTQRRVAHDSRPVGNHVLVVTHQPQQAGGAVQVDHVVTIDKAKPGSHGSSDAGVAGPGYATMLNTEDAQAPVPDPAQQARHRLGTSIVH